MIVKGKNNLLNNKVIHRFIHSHHQEPRNTEEVANAGLSDAGATNSVT